MQMTRNAVVTMILAALFGLLLAGGLPIGDARAATLTKVAPTEAEPGEPFTIIDAHLARLVEGTVALFRLPGGSDVEVPLRTHKPFKTAHGRLPSGIAAGDYTVWLRLPGGGLIEVGAFHVIGVAPQPSVTPSSGPIGSGFTVVDPLGRIQPGDIAVFYIEGTNPALGTPADNVSTAFGMLTGNVPEVLPGLQYFIAVTPALGSPSRFADLAFFVTAPQPSVIPSTGLIGTAFYITDPFGRIQPGDLAVFYLEGTNPAGGVPADNVSISLDGTSLTGNVPEVLPGQQYFISVTPALGSPSRFGDLAFFVL